jgi:hypothetical protein
MLVYAKQPRGILYIGKEPIYGREMIQGPSDIPYKVFEAYKDGLEEGTYREGFLSKLFGNPDFPEVAFKYSDLRFLPEKTLNKICVGMKMRIFKKTTRIAKIKMIKKALREKSPDVVTSA